MPDSSSTHLDKLYKSVMNICWNWPKI